MGAAVKPVRRVSAALAGGGGGGASPRGRGLAGEGFPMTGKGREN